MHRTDPARSRCRGSSMTPNFGLAIGPVCSHCRWPTGGSSRSRPRLPAHRSRAFSGARPFLGKLFAEKWCLTPIAAGRYTFSPLCVQPSERSSPSFHLRSSSVEPAAPALQLSNAPFFLLLGPGRKKAPRNPFNGLPAATDAISPLHDPPD